MELSIIIITFNSFEFIEKCIQSVLKRVKGMDYELIIVDNNSKDETCSLIEEKFPEAFLIRNHSNEGFAKANNQALQKAKGDFVLLLNPDTEWKRGELREAIHFLKNDEKIAALGCRLLLEDGIWQKSYGNFPTLTREIKETFYLPKIFSGLKWMKGVYAYQEIKNPIPVDWASCTFFLFKREMLKRVGYLDGKYFMYYEDIDLSKRIRETGKEIFYFPKIEIIHYQKGISLIDYGESPYIYFNKHFGFNFARYLRYILLLKAFIRLCIFFTLAFFTHKIVFKEKFYSNVHTFKFHLFEASNVLRSLKVES